jgi:hypothetical protein
MLVGGGQKTAIYAGVYDFDRKTSGRFARHLTVDGERLFGAGKELTAKSSPNGLYRPIDMHALHKWTYAGQRFDGLRILRCAGCTAAQMGA